MANSTSTVVHVDPDSQLYHWVLEIDEHAVICLGTHDAHVKFHVAKNETALQAWAASLKLLSEQLSEDANELQASRIAGLVPATDPAAYPPSEFPGGDPA